YQNCYYYKYSSQIQYTTKGFVSYHRSNQKHTIALVVRKGPLFVRYKDAVPARSIEIWKYPIFDALCRIGYLHKNWLIMIEIRTITGVYASIRVQNCTIF